jgi:hypothetical protein
LLSRGKKGNLIIETLWVADNKEQKRKILTSKKALARGFLLSKCAQYSKHSQVVLSTWHCRYKYVNENCGLARTQHNIPSAMFLKQSCFCKIHQRACKNGACDTSRDTSALAELSEIFQLEMGLL